MSCEIKPVHLRDQLGKMEIPLGFLVSHVKYELPDDFTFYDIWHETVAKPKEQPEVSLLSLTELAMYVGARDPPHFFIFTRTWDLDVKEFEFWDMKISVRVSEHCPPDKIIVFSTTEDPIRPWKLEGLILLEPKP